MLAPFIKRDGNGTLYAWLYAGIEYSKSSSDTDPGPTVHATSIESNFAYCILIYSVSLRLIAHAMRYPCTLALSVSRGRASCRSEFTLPSTRSWTQALADGVQAKQTGGSQGAPCWSSAPEDVQDHVPPRDVRVDGLVLVQRRPQDLQRVRADIAAAAESTACRGWPKLKSSTLQRRPSAPH